MPSAPIWSAIWHDGAQVSVPSQPEPSSAARPMADLPAYGPSALATPANAVTVVRLLVAPVLFAMIAANPASWTNFAIWILLSATDGIDGFIARRHGATRSGAFLDPLADKVLVLGAMCALVAAGVFAIVPVAIIAVREVAISLFRVRLSRSGLAVPARQSAKLKTMLQTAAVAAAIMPSLVEVRWLADVLLWTSVFVALVSGWQYLRDGRRAATAM